MRVLLTGGTGKAGHHVVPYLLERGHTVTNLDQEPLGLAGVQDLLADLTDLGQVLSALRMPASPADLDLEIGRGGGWDDIPAYDAVVHLAAIPRPWLRTDSDTYRNNVLSTYNVLEAAEAVGVRKVVFASSETTYGICFGQGNRKPDYVPVDEEHPTVPEDAYAMAKVASEVTARSFQRRTGHDVYGLRINNVIEPHEYAELFPHFLTDPAQRRRNLFAYIDVRDLAQAIDRCLTTDSLGYQVFNIANADHSVAATTDELIEEFYGGVEVRRKMGKTETFFSIAKARDLLGYEPTHSWRDVLDDPRT